MSNTSDRYIQKITSIGLFYSRVFGVGNYTYDFKKNRLSFSRRVVSYTIAFDLLIIVFLPASLITLFKSDRKHMSENPLVVDIQRTIAISHAITVYISFLWQWVNLPHYKLLLERLTKVRIGECSKLSRSAGTVKKKTLLILSKLILSATFPLGAFTGVYLKSDKYLLESIVSALSILVIENVVIIVENQFYIGILYCGFLFEVLNDHTLKVVNKILNIDRKRLPQNRMGVSMQKCCSLCDDLELIGNMHTEIFKLATIITKLYGTQLLIIILSMLTTQVTLGFYAIVYFGQNNTQVTSAMFYLSCAGLIITTVNLRLLVYVCSTVVNACNQCGERLKLLTAVQYLDSRLDTEIERLAFQMKQEELHINLSGLIDVDMRTGFYLVKVAVLNLVLLIQRDYKNLSNVFKNDGQM